MKAELFRDISARYASIVGRRDGVRVIFQPGGTTAFTDGNTIVIPDVPYGTVLSDHQVKVYGGYLDHEAAHCRHTDFKPIQGLSGEVKWVENVLEDVRIENIQISRYPGMKQYLDALCQEVDSKDSRNPNRIMSALYKEAWKYRGVDVPQVKESLEDLGLKQVADLVAQVSELKSTDQTVKLAKRIVEMLKHEVKQQEEKRDEKRVETNPERQKGVGKVAEGDKEDQESSGEEPGENQNSDGVPGEENTGAVGGGMAEGHDGSSGQGHSGGVTQSELDQAVAGMQQAKDDSRQEAIKEALKGEMEDGPKQIKNPKRRKPISGGTILPPVDKSKDQIMVRPSREMGDVDKVQSGRLATELMRTLQARDKRAWTRDQEEGDLDTDSLPQVAMGSTRIYQTKRDRVTMSTAIEVDIDLSSSMNTNVVRQCAILLSEGLNAVSKVKFQICGFHCPDRSLSLPEGYRPSSGGLGRMSPMKFEVLKRFEESYASAKKYIGGVRADGFTPLGDAYAIGMENLIRRKERKKVLLIVTDGLPYFNVADDRHSDFLLMSRINQTCKKFGILTAGLVIEDEDVDLKEYFQVWEQFKSGELIDSLLKLVEKLV